MPDTPPWAEQLLSDAREVVLDLLQEPVIDPVDLAEQVRSYALAIESAPKADQDLGRHLVTGCLALLEAPLEAEDAKLAQVAVRYFVLDDDGDDDLASPFGLDDDAEVFNTIVQLIGRPDLALSF